MESDSTYFDGTAFTLGSFPVRWYGIMYIFAFATGYLTLLHINKKENLGYTKEQFDSLPPRLRVPRPIWSIPAAATPPQKPSAA